MKRAHQRPRKAAPKKRVRHSSKPAKQPDPKPAADYSGYDAYSQMYGYEVSDDIVDGALTVPVFDIGADPYLH